MRWLIAACLIIGPLSAWAQEKYNFNVEEFQKKPLELNGYAEFRMDRFTFDPNAALYELGLFDQPAPSTPNRRTETVQVQGIARHGIWTANVLVNGAYADDYTGNDRNTRLYEGYLSAQPGIGTTVDAGKHTLSWGKGYAWNPIGFVQRPKDPNDPELAREGFVMAGGDFVHSFTGGRLQTLAFTPLIVPTTADINSDFGIGDHLNPAAKLYMLYANTDIDLAVLGGGARSARYGFDFSRNIATNLEVHGEWAHIGSTPRPVVDASGKILPLTSNAATYLVGLRYLNQYDLTTILEYYYNGAGYSDDEMSAIASTIHAAYDRYLASGNPTEMDRLRTVFQSTLGRPTPGRRYVYLRLSWKEPFDILYFTPALTTMANVDDSSFSITPELLYTRYKNTELRLRVFWLHGARLSDFGEKINERRIELRARYYF